MSGILKQLQDDLMLRKFTFSVRETNESFVLEVSNGSIKITVWPPKESNYKKPLKTIKFTTAGGIPQLRKLMHESNTLNPGDRRAIILTRWDRDSKKEVPELTLILGKDDKGIFYIELQFMFNNNNKVLKADIMSFERVQYGSTALDWTGKSELGMEAIKYWLDYEVPMGCILTAGQFRPPVGNGGGNGGGGGNSGSTYA